MLAACCWKTRSPREGDRVSSRGRRVDQERATQRVCHSTGATRGGAARAASSADAGSPGSRRAQQLHAIGPGAVGPIRCRRSGSGSRWDGVIAVGEIVTRTCRPGRKSTAPKDRVKRGSDPVVRRCESMPPEAQGAQHAETAHSSIDTVPRAPRAPLRCDRGDRRRERLNRRRGRCGPAAASRRRLVGA